jgi:hypothetical protein
MKTMNHKNLDELRHMSVPQLTEVYLDRLFGGNKVFAFNADAVNFSNDRSANLNDLKISDTNRDSVLSQAEQDAAAYAEARNKRTQPANLSGFDQNLVKSVREWVAKKQNYLRGGKKT